MQSEHEQTLVVSHPPVLKMLKGWRVFIFTNEPTASNLIAYLSNSIDMIACN